jgi:TetR/AcrR family transcriptional regulator, transcriptional repressor for nem operon
MRNSTRTWLVEVADRLVLEQGYKQTTLADIAQEANVRLGNIYYYFRTKDDLGRALIDLRANYYSGLRELWERNPDARTRLHAFIQMTIDNRELLARSGCPIGSLCQELHKEGGPLAAQAGEMLAQLLDWLKTQFELLGMGEESADHALHLLSALQGASLLTNTMKAPDIMLQETARLMEWVNQL